MGTKLMQTSLDDFVKYFHWVYAVLENHKIIHIGQKLILSIKLSI